MDRLNEDYERLFFELETMEKAFEEAMKDIGARFTVQVIQK